jgi:hypothetical protein
MRTLQHPTVTQVNLWTSEALAGTNPLRFYHLLAANGFQGLDTAQHHELASHLMKAVVAPGTASYQKLGGLPQMGEHPAVSSSAGFMRRGGDGTTVGTFVWGINVTTTAEQGEHDGTAASALFAEFKAVLARAAGGGEVGARL